MKLIESSEHTNYSLARESGVDKEVIRRFMKGTRDLTLATAGRICAALGVKPLEVTKRRGR